MFVVKRVRIPDRPAEALVWVCCVVALCRFTLWLCCVVASYHGLDVSACLTNVDSAPAMVLWISSDRWRWE